MVQIRPGVFYDEESLFTCHVLAPSESQLILQDDYDWYLNNYIELSKKYGGCCLAIKNKTVLGSYISINEAVRKTKNIEAPGTFVVVELDKHTIID